MVTAPGSGLRSVPDLLRQAKAHSEKLTFGSGGHGTTPHMAGELLKASVGVKLMHVAYKGSQPALTDAMAGRLDIAFDGVASAVGYIRSGELVALGVGTRERLTALPDVAPIDEVNRALNSPALLDRFQRLSVTPLGGSPADMEQHVRTELNKWKRIVAENGIQAQ